MSAAKRDSRFSSKSAHLVQPGVLSSVLEQDVEPLFFDGVYQQKRMMSPNQNLELTKLVS